MNEADMESFHQRPWKINGPCNVIVLKWLKDYIAQVLFKSNKKYLLGSIIFILSIALWFKLGFLQTVNGHLKVLRFLINNYTSSITIQKLFFFRSTC